MPLSRCLPFSYLTCSDPSYSASAQSSASVECFSVFKREYVSIVRNELRAQSGVNLNHVTAKLYKIRLARPRIRASTRFRLHGT